MPINSESESGAALTAIRESSTWATIHQQWTSGKHPVVWADVPAIERIVIPEVDPGDDLRRRTGRWGYELGAADLSDLARFASALARTEAEAWRDGDHPLATRAYEERRFLVADRIMPWAVAWLRAVARCFPEKRDEATSTGETLLTLGEQHRPAPRLSGPEGVYLPGHDGYGPADAPEDLGNRLVSLWGGMVVFDRSLESLTGRPVTRRTQWTRDPDSNAAVAAWYEIAAVRWERLAERFPGTAQYWVDLAVRARRTTDAAI